jgi:hypothetical protein
MHVGDDFYCFCQHHTAYIHVTQFIISMICNDQQVITVIINIIIFNLLPVVIFHSMYTVLYDIISNTPLSESRIPTMLHNYIIKYI